MLLIAVRAGRLVRGHLVPCVALQLVNRQLCKVICLGPLIRLSPPPPPLPHMHTHADQCGSLQIFETARPRRKGGRARGIIITARFWSAAWIQVRCSKIALIRNPQICFGAARLVDALSPCPSRRLCRVTYPGGAWGGSLQNTTQLGASTALRTPTIHKHADHHAPLKAGCTLPIHRHNTPPCPPLTPHPPFEADSTPP